MKANNPINRILQPSLLKRGKHTTESKWLYIFKSCYQAIISLPMIEQYQFFAILIAKSTAILRSMTEPLANSFQTA